MCTGYYSYLKKIASESTTSLSSIQSESTTSLSSSQSESIPSLSSIQNIILNSTSMCRHIYDYNIVHCDVKQSIYLYLVARSYYIFSEIHTEDDGICKSEDDLLQRLSEIFGNNIVILSFHFTPDLLSTVKIMITIHL